MGCWGCWGGGGAFGGMTLVGCLRIMGGVECGLQLNIDYPTTSGQTTVRRCSDKANVLDKKKLSLTHFQWLLLAARPFYFLLFKIFVFFEWLTTCTVRTLRHVRPKKLLRIIEWSDSRCADNRCSTVCANLVSRPFEDSETSGRLSMAGPTSTIPPHASPMLAHASPMCLRVSCVSC